jgi:hypothetical protein
LLNKELASASACAYNAKREKETDQLSSAPGFGSINSVGDAMSEPSNNGERMFRVCFRTVEFFGILLVGAFWLFLFTGSVWGDKFHYRYLFDVSVPVMMIVSVSAILTWRRYRKDSLLQVAVLFGWAIWAALPRL